MEMEQEKKERYDAFRIRFDFYVKTFIDSGFTKEQAERLAQEFSEFKEI